MIAIQQLIFQISSNTKKTIKKYEIVRLLNEKIYKIKFIAHINTRLMNNIVEEREFSNDILFSKNM